MPIFAGFWRQKWHGYTAAIARPHAARRGTASIKVGESFAEAGIKAGPPSRMAVITRRYERPPAAPIAVTSAATQPNKTLPFGIKTLHNATK